MHYLCFRTKKTKTFSLGCNIRGYSEQELWIDCIDCLSLNFKVSGFRRQQWDTNFNRFVWLSRPSVLSSADIRQPFSIIELYSASQQASEAAVLPVDILKHVLNIQVFFLYLNVPKNSLKYIKKHIKLKCIISVTNMERNVYCHCYLFPQKPWHKMDQFKKCRGDLGDGPVPVIALKCAMRKNDPGCVKFGFIMAGRDADCGEIITAQFIFFPFLSFYVLFFKCMWVSGP